MKKDQIILLCWTKGHEDYIQMLTSVENYEFLQAIADLEIDQYGVKTYIVNNQRFKFFGYKRQD